MALAKTDADRLGKDFDKQLGAVAEAETTFAQPAATTTPAPVAGGGGGANAAPAGPSRLGREQVRKNQQNAVDLAF